MTKALFAVIVVALAVAALMLPVLPAPEPAPGAAVDLPAVAVCPVEEGGGRATTIAVASTQSGTGRVSAFVGGTMAGSVPFETGSGAITVPASDLAAVGVVTGLVELPGPEAAAASLMVGTDSVGHESCVRSAEPLTLLSGGDTTGDREFEIHLMNPYSGEATVDLTVRSESGIESASQLRGIAVPSRSSVIVDMDEVLPGRESLAVAIDVTSGSVTAAGRLLSSGGIAIWNAVSPGQDWFLPIPSGGVDRVYISTGVGDDVEYQLDLYGPEGLVEAFDQGMVPARGSVAVDVAAAATAEAVAFRVVSTQPVGVFLRHEGEDGLALTSGSTVTASRWLLPGAGMAGGSGRIVVLNAGLEDATATITAYGRETVVKGPPVRAGTVLEFASISDGASAYTVTGEGLLVPMWVTTTGTATSYAGGVPLIDE